MGKMGASKPPEMEEVAGEHESFLARLPVSPYTLAGAAFLVLALLVAAWVMLSNPR
jgi:hypothetical protein